MEKIEFYIKNSRQRRALKALLQKTSIPVKDIGIEIGALNPRQIIMNLRHQGFCGFIRTRRFPVVDRDGKTCLPGEYYIPQELKPTIAKFLEECTSEENTEDKYKPHNTQEE